mgnify:FL=1
MSRVYEHGPGFVRAVACPDCGHTKCGESCVCNCDAARAEDALARLRVEAERLARESEAWRLRWESVSEECDRARACAPPWLADAAEALGEVRPEDGAPLALNWTQVIEAIHELREDRDHWKKRGEAAEFSLSMCRDELAAIRRCQDEEADFVAAGGLSGRQR